MKPQVPQGPQGSQRPQTLAGKVALVTGASRGIGAGIAKRLARAGADVALVYKERANSVAEVQAQIAAEGARTAAFAADLTDAAACARVVAEVAAEMGDPDILVHSAGVAYYGLVLDTSTAAWDMLHNLHARAPFLLAKTALPAMIQRGWGRIIVVSSIWGLVGAANEVAYSASKAAQLGLVRSLAKEVARAGITVNAVAPGAVHTEMLAGFSTDELAEFADQVPMGRLGSVADVAAVVAFLADPENSYLSGQVISPNGAFVV